MLSDCKPSLVGLDLVMAQVLKEETTTVTTVSSMFVPNCLLCEGRMSCCVKPRLQSLQTHQSSNQEWHCILQSRLLSNARKTGSPVAVPRSTTL